MNYKYFPHTEEDLQEMLKATGAKTIPSIVPMSMFNISTLTVLAFGTTPPTASPASPSMLPHATL